MTTKASHYGVLGLTPDASDEDIKKAYRRLALFWHPDKNPERREEASNVFTLVSHAYAVLGDPVQKKKYDRDVLPGANKAAATPSAAPASARPAPSAPPAPPPASTPAPVPTPSAPPEPHAAPQQEHQNVRQPKERPPQHVPQHEYDQTPQQGMHQQGMHPQGMHQQGAWGVGGAPWQGGGYDYDPGWGNQYQQGPQGFGQPHQFPQQPGAFPYPQDNAYPYGNPYDNRYDQQGYPFQQQQYQQQQHAQQQAQQQQAQQQFGGHFGGYVPPPPPAGLPLPMPPEMASTTELCLAPTSAPAPPAHSAFDHGYNPYGHPVGFPIQHPAAGAAMVASTPTPSMSSSEEEDDDEDSSDSEEEDLRHRAVVPAKVKSPARRRSSSAFQLLTRRSNNRPSYPTETRYVPPAPPRMNANYYPTETRSHQAAEQARPASVNRSRSGKLMLSLVLSASLPAASASGGGNSTAPAPAPAPASQRHAQARSASMGRSVVSRDRNSVGSNLGSDGGSVGGREKFSGGGLLKSMDRMFASVMGATTMTAEDVLGKGGYPSSTSGSGGGVGGEAGGGRGVGTMSMRSSRTTRVGVDGTSRTVHSRTERTVIHSDGSRDNQVQEFRESTNSLPRGSVMGGSNGAQRPSPGLTAADLSRIHAAGRAGEMERSASSTGRKKGVMKLFGNGR